MASRRHEKMIVHTAHLAFNIFNSQLTSGDVSGRESDDELLCLGALGLGLGHQVLVDDLDGSLEAGELGHRVGDLAAPQRPDGLVEATDALLSPDLNLPTADVTEDSTM